MNLDSDFGVVVSELEGFTASSGGVGVRYANLLKEFENQDFRPKVLLFADLARKDMKPTSAQFSVETLSRLIPGPARVLVRVLITYFWLRRNGIRVLLAPDWQGLAALKPRHTTLVTNLVTNLNNIRHHFPTLTESFLHQAFSRIQILLERKQTQNSTSLISISSALADWAVREGISRPCVVIPNPVSVSRNADSFGDNERNVNDYSRYFLFVGRLERRKGIHETLVAFESISELQPDIRLRLAGAEGDLNIEDSLDDLLRRYCPRSRKNVEWLGKLSREDLFGEIEHSLAVLTPSLWEGFGNATAEALALGGTVIATSGSGFDDFCVDGINCLLAKPGDWESLFFCMKRVILEPNLRAQLSSEAMLINETHSLNKIAEKYISHLRFVGDQFVT